MEPAPTSSSEPLSQRSEAYYGVTIVTPKRTSHALASTTSIDGAGAILLPTVTLGTLETLAAAKPLASLSVQDFVLVRISCQLYFAAA
jgi:hypothetical protein